MVAHVVNAFRGEVPLLTPRALPDSAAQEAINTRLYTGDLTAFKQFATTKGLANPETVRTIALLKDWWMSWETDVDVARGIIPGDTTYRTYLTGLDAPRFTNLDLATGDPNGSAPEPYPFETRLLGVPAPDNAPTTSTSSGTNPDVDTTDTGDQFSSWVTSGTVNIPGTTESEVSNDATIGNPAPSYKMLAGNNVSAPCYLYRNFGVGNSVVVEFDSEVAFDSNGAVLGCAWTIATSESGAGCVVGVGYTQGASGGVFLVIGTKAAWADPGSWLVQIPMSMLDGSHATWYSMSIKLTRNADGTSTVDAVFKNGSTVLGTAALTAPFVTGGYCGFNNIVGFPMPAIAAYLDNIEVKGSGVFNDATTTVATNYVYTFVNDLGEESAPSLPSATILRPDGVSVAVTTPTSVPTGISGDYFIETKRIYRAATGSSGTAYRFVAEIPLSQADYVDTLTDSELGEVLQSDNWALPPDDLRGILALPNGVMVGFRRNQLCFSAQNHPHAWPVEYRLNTDTDIVGIGNIDTTVVVGTKSFLYTATGNDPAAYSMGKFEVPYAASSKRSFAYVTGLGVVFSGPDGLMACAGPGQVGNLTQKVFTRRQWQALDPTSIVSVSHNDIYFMFWESASAKGCYAVDLRNDGFGIVQMAFHASAAYVDPIHDKLYLVLDSNSEPDDEMLPIPASIPTYIDGRTIFEFEGSASEYMNYRWRSKLWLTEYPSFYPIAQVRRGDADGTQGNLIARFYGDGVLLDEILIEGDVEFTLTPPDAAYSKFFMELTGTDPINVLQAADDATELS